MSSFCDKVVYQIYPKSFMDTNGDGLGDLKGIISKLEYLKDLGVDIIWITPIFKSPQVDNGYDVEDYYSIDPLYGTMEEFEELCTKANELDLEIMLDMVFNHTSTKHEWFQKALAGEEHFQEYYIIKKAEEGQVPTNWVSKFGGNAWKYEEAFQGYYLHLFDQTQADLNWENPLVRNEMAKIVNFWIDKGVHGFRFDVVNLISKPRVYVDDLIGDGRRFYTDGVHVHDYLKELNKNSYGKHGCITVGEMSSTNLENCVKYAGRNSDELSMVFSFHHLKVDYKDQDKWKLKPFDFIELKKLLCEYQVGMQNADAWNAVFWCNHDQPRIVSRFGDEHTYWKESSKMLATAIHMLRGTPYIYQGEEIGMTNANFDDISFYRDVETLNYYQILKEQGMDEKEVWKVIQERSRDNGRTPMQWDDTENAGFSNVTPWICVNKNYPNINVKQQMNEEDSIYNYYRKLIQLRKEFACISKGRIQFLELNHPKLFMYKRYTDDEKLLVICNFYGDEVTYEYDFDEYEVLLCNYDVVNNSTIRPYEARVLIRKKENDVF